MSYDFEEGTIYFLNCYPVNFRSIRFVRAILLIFTHSSSEFAQLHLEVLCL